MIRFFHTLFEGYDFFGYGEPGLRLEIRCLAPQWKIEPEYPRFRRFFSLSENGYRDADRYCGRVCKEWDIYFGVLPRRGESGKGSDVAGALCLFADVDGGEDGIEGAVELVKRDPFLPSPNLVVVSGGGLHCYWLLKAPLWFENAKGREDYSVTLRRLQKVIGGSAPGAHADPACKDAARVLRVPGTYNLKRETEPRLVRLLRLNMQERYHYSEWQKMLPLVPTIPKEEPRRWTEPRDDMPKWLTDWIQTPLPKGNRNREITRVGAYVAREYRWDFQTVLTVLNAKNGACLPPIEEEELKRIAHWATKG